MDFVEVMRVLRDVQLSASICPDHMPRHSADAGGLQSFAFGYGYIKALILAVNSQVPADAFRRVDASAQEAPPC